MSKIYLKPPLSRNVLVCSNPPSEKRFYSLHKRLSRFVINWHSHELAQLVMAEHGTLHINVEGTCMVIPPWYCAWIPPYLSHEVWSMAPDITFRTLFFDSKVCKKSFYRTPAIFPVTPVLREMIKHTERWNDRHDNDPYEQTFMRAIEQTLPIAMEASVNIKLPSSTNERLLDIIEYLQEHLHEKIIVDDIAIRFGISSRSLHRLFTQHLGIPFSAYLRIMRIIHSVELLSLGNHSIAEVAASVGYDSLPTFSNNFMEIIGNRPSYFIPGNKERINSEHIAMSYLTTH